MRNLRRKEGVLLAIALVFICVAAYFSYSYVVDTNAKLEAAYGQLEEREEEEIKLNKQIESLQSMQESLMRKVKEKEDVEKRYERIATNLTSRGVDRRIAIASANKLYIYTFLQDKGMTPIAIAGIMGNIEQESKYNPQSDNGSHRGICQWDYSIRWPRLVSSQEDPDDIKSQTEFMWQELEERGLVDTLNNSEDIYTATEVFDSGFEGSGGREIYQRVAYANKIYQVICNA